MTGNDRHRRWFDDAGSRNAGDGRFTVHYRDEARRVLPAGDVASPQEAGPINIATPILALRRRDACRRARWCLSRQQAALPTTTRTGRRLRCFRSFVDLRERLAKARPA